MSVPKSFEQVLADWRMHAENRYAAEATGHEWTASRKATLKSCADEAQPILDKLREEVEKMPHAAQRAIPVISMPSGMPIGEAKVCSLACSRCILERILGERET